MHIGKRRAVVADWVGEGATTVGRAHRVVDEHPIGREKVDPAIQIFAFGNCIGVTNSGHVVIVHELLLSQQSGSFNFSAVWQLRRNTFAVPSNHGSLSKKR